MFKFLELSKLLILFNIIFKFPCYPLAVIFCVTNNLRCCSKKKKYAIGLLYFRRPDKRALLMRKQLKSTGLP